MQPNNGFTEIHPTLWMYTHQTTDSTNVSECKVAAFDMDNTLINTKSGATYAEDREDWDWCYDTVPSTLEKLSRDGYVIAILTNQLGISKLATTVEEVTGKVRDILAKLALGRVFVFMATDKNIYRKPFTGMWRALAAQVAPTTIDLVASFYCGDAAGRVYARRSKDFSASDYYFAHNCRVPFHVPEELFAPTSPRVRTSKAALYELPLSRPAGATSAEEARRIIVHDLQNYQVLVIMIGCPGSGKSTFARTLTGFTIVNQDTLKTKTKCLKAAQGAITRGESLVIDNTNPTQETRNEYIHMFEAAPATGKPHTLVACIMATPELLAKHLNNARVELEGHSLVPDIVYNMFRKKYEFDNTTGVFGTVLRVFPDIKAVPEVTQFRYDI